MESHELCDYVRTSTISIKSKIGVGIMKELSVSVAGKESLDVKSDFGKIYKNEVPIESLCASLQVSYVGFTSGTPKMCLLLLKLGLIS